MPSRLIAVLTLLFVASACTGGGDSGVPQPPPQAGSEQQPAATEGADEQDGGTVTASPDASVDATCEPQPQAVRGDTEVLVAQVSVENTGNIGVKVRVVARWPQPQGQGLIRWKRVNVDEGTIRELALRIRVGEREARAVRRAVELGRECSVNHRVIGAYGAPSS